MVNITILELGDFGLTCVDLADLTKRVNAIHSSNKTRNLPPLFKL